MSAHTTYSSEITIYLGVIALFLAVNLGARMFFTLSARKDAEQGTEADDATVDRDAVSV